jgi:TRAP-type C4-dicarboxylate transport system permease small subunit
VPKKAKRGSAAWIVLAVLFLIFAVGAFGGAALDYMAMQSLNSIGAGGIGNIFTGYFAVELGMGVLFLIIVIVSVHAYRKGQ